MKYWFVPVLLVALLYAPGRSFAAACQKSMNVRTLAQELYDISAYSQLAPHAVRLSYFARYLQKIAGSDQPCHKIERAFQHVRSTWGDLEKKLDREDSHLKKDRRRLRQVYLRLKAGVAAKNVYSSLFFDSNQAPAGPAARDSARAPDSLR